MRDIFIADAHLADPVEESYKNLVAFLDELRGSTRTLYLLGDIFEFWVGYKHAVFAPYVPLLEALRRLKEEGTEIVFVEGNHDFHMGPYFAETLGCRILPDGGEVAIDGRRVYIAHGDMVKEDDRGYRLLRRFLRNSLTKAIIALIPPDWAWGIARWGSCRSQEGQPAKSERTLPEEMLRDHALALFRDGFEAVVTGHFHIPYHQRGPEGELIALGDWMDRYSYAVLEDGIFTLRCYSRS